MPDRNRLRLQTFEAHPEAGGRVAARVVLLQWDDKQIEGEAVCEDSPAGRLRCAADATARALERAVDGRITFDVLGVKTIHAFDCILAVVSLTGRLEDSTERLVGSCIVSSENPRGIVLATLNATNRLVGQNLLQVKVDG
jgi:hypothetical protein